jgi:hypothetical protein
MRRSVLTSVAITAAVVAGVVSVSAASQADAPSEVNSKTLIFDVVFSPSSLVKANNVRVPHSPIALGDELTFHDQLYSKGHHAGDDVGSCVIVTIPPAAVLANCTAVFRVPGGNITAQFAAIQGPTPKAIALSGGTGNYRDIGGDGTLVEFGNGKGRLTLHVLSHTEEAD